MSYILNGIEWDLDRVMQRILDTDLTPSLQPIKEDIKNKFDRLKKNGAANLQELRKMLKDKKRISETESKTGIDAHYLILLRREVGGWIAEKAKIDKYAWFDKKLIEALKGNNMWNMEDVYTNLDTKGKRDEFSKTHNIGIEKIETVYKLADISRVRWASPNVARILVELGYSADSLKKADSTELAKAIGEINSRGKYYQGKISERDVDRLIKESSYIV